MARTTTARRVGAIYQFDDQADIWRGRYKLVERVAPSTWLCERLADDAATVAAIVAFWEGAEARVASGALPGVYVRQGATCADMLFDELDHRAALAGTTLRMRFVSAADYARHF